MDTRVVISRDKNNNQDDSYRSEGEWSEEDKEVSSRYAKRLNIVNEWCELGLQPLHSEEQTAFGAREKTELVRLPPAEEYVQEV